MRHRIRYLILPCAVALLFVQSGRAQTDVTEITASTEPSNGLIRPYGTATIRVEAYGTVTGPNGKRERVRVEPGGVEFHVVEQGGGWLSDPFASQEPGSRHYFLRRRQGPTSPFDLRDFNPGAIPGLRDSVLFTAPVQPGEYHVEADLEGKRAVVTLHVEEAAPSSRPPEKVSFSRELHSASPYRDIAEHYAPFVAQQTWFDPKADYLARFDFDGDWHGDDNWDDTPTGSSQAYVYYAVMETQTHWFVIYNFFHPRNYAERCVLGTCHENDNEGIILTVRKDGSRFGQLQVMETLAHNRVYTYRADKRVQGGLHRISGAIDFFDGSHPVVYVQPGGHGVFGSQDRHSGYSVQSGGFVHGTGVTYRYRGRDQRPRYANDRLVGYDLLSIYKQWWLRGVDGSGRRDGTFDDYCVYTPKGNRPKTPYPKIPCSFLGRAKARDRAKPFWGWFDLNSRSALATGQWGLDPAYAVSETLHFPSDEPFSLDYTYNRYLLPAGNPH